LCGTSALVFYYKPAKDSGSGNHQLFKNGLKLDKNLIVRPSLAGLPLIRLESCKNCKPFEGLFVKT
jgi:hypothetical protein